MIVSRPMNRNVLWFMVLGMAFPGLPETGTSVASLNEGYRRVKESATVKLISSSEREALTSKLNAILTKPFLYDYYEKIKARTQNGSVTSEEVIAEVGAWISQVKGLIKDIRVKDELSSLVIDDIRQVDILKAASEFIFQFEKDLSLEQIKAVFLRNKELSQLLIKYFEALFNPQFDLTQRIVNSNGIRGEFLEKAQRVAESDKQILKLALELFSGTLKTDYYLEDRISLGLRLDPAKISAFYDKRRFPEWPFAVIWVHVPYGAYGSHIRFQDVARGGIRELKNIPQLRNAVLTENYALVLTQQFKNVDIPEGGSKGTFIFDGGLNPVAVAIGYLDSLINFMQGSDKMVYYGKEQYAVDPLELGPDEGTDVISTLASVQAKMKGLSGWRQFMTAKLPLLGGVPHKDNNLLNPPVIGNRVTSQGVMIHLDEAWKFLGINPLNQPVRINFTGGPHGDVGSGDIEIAIRKYGKNAKIISVTDSTGTAYDENGLDHEELMRLYNADTSIVNFDRRKLGKTAFLAPASSDFVELGPEVLENFNVKALNFYAGAGVEILEKSGQIPTRVKIKSDLLRDTIFFLAYADAFVPGGGLRDTISEKNMDLFFDLDGRPMAKTVVYGANVFTTPGANNFLESKGILVIPDEKANSVGVEVSSRTEVDGNLFFALGEMRNLMPQYFARVLEKLQANAVKKNWALMLEKRRHPGQFTVTEISPAVSKEIVRLSRVIEDSFASFPPGLIEAYLKNYYPDMPEVISRLGSIPQSRLQATVSKYIAATVVYNAGFDYVLKTARETGFSESAVIRAYAQAALETGLEKRKAEIFGQKYTLAPEEQMRRLLEIEQQQQSYVLNLLRR